MPTRALVIFSLLLLSALLSPVEARERAYRERLPNGATLVVLPSRSSPTVSLNVFLKVGSFEEGPEWSGIAHFYEHLFFRGTPTRSGFQFKRAIEALGGSTNASTSRDMTHYYINLPRHFALEGLELLSDALIHAELAPDAIDQERKAVLEEYRLGAESPARIVNGRIFQLVFGEHPYGKPIIGTEENIRRFTRPDFTEFRDRFYSPERTTVVIVGDIEPGEVLPRARDLFGSFRRDRPSPVSTAPLPPPPGEEVRVVETLSSRTSFVVLGFLGPSVKDRPEVYQVDVLSFLLGVGKGSLLNRGLVDQGKAMDTSVDFLTQREPGLIVVSGICAAGQEESTRKELLATLERVRRGEFSDRDLQRAKTFLRSTYLYGNETHSGKADSLGFYAAIDDLEFATSYLARVEGVTREQVIEAAHRYFGQGYHCLILEGRVEEERRRAAR